jgi:hypothetical protein
MAKTSSKSEASKKDDKKAKKDKEISHDNKKTKKDKVESVKKEKREYPNHESESIKSYINTSATKQWMKDFCDRFPLIRKKKVVDESIKSSDTESDDEDKDTKKKKKNIVPRIGISRAHCVVSAIDQSMIIALVNMAEQKTKKATAELYTITEEILMDVIRLNKDYNYIFGKYLDNYNSREAYCSQLKIDKKNFQKILTNLAFDGKTNVVVDKSGENFIMFIILTNRIMLTETSFFMAQYAKRMSIDDKAILYATKILYTGHMAKLFYKKVEDVMNILIEEREARKEDGLASEDKTTSTIDKKKDDKKKDDKKVIKKSKSSSSSDLSSDSDDSETSESSSDSDSS